MMMIIIVFSVWYVSVTWCLCKQLWEDFSSRSSIPRFWNWISETAYQKSAKSSREVTTATQEMGRGWIQKWPSAESYPITICKTEAGRDGLYSNVRGGKGSQNLVISQI